MQEETTLEPSVESSSTGLMEVTCGDMCKTRQRHNSEAVEPNLYKVGLTVVVERPESP